MSTLDDAQLTEIRHAAEAKYGKDEIDRFITMGKQLAGKVVLGALIWVIEEGPKKGKSAATAKKLVRRITDLIPYPYSGFLQIFFKEIPYRLNISLSLTPRDYKTAIDIPHDSYAKEMFDKYDFLRNTATAYWQQFSEENSQLLGQICNYRSDVDFTSLVTDADNITTMYFDPDAAKRIGILCYYVDENGKPFYRKE